MVTQAETQIIDILVVEDDPGDRRLIKLILARSLDTLRFHVTSATTVREATARLGNGSYGVILLDLGLPDGGGLNTIQAIHGVSPHVPIVVLTGLNDEDLGLEAIKWGAQDYLIKGSSLDYLLIRAIRYAIERKRAEQQIQQAVEVKSQFISMASHELRTPLTAIKESIDIVTEGAAAVLNAEMKEFLRLAKRNIDRLSRLINDVLDIQKLESGLVEFHMQESDINEVIQEVSASMTPVAGQKGLELSLSLIDNPPLIRFDRDKITQVLVNLMNNAIKFTETGVITVATTQEGKAIVTTIADTGPGIRKEDIGKLFQKFQQLGGPDQRKAGGTGLGLAICKQIIEKHAGKIWADSKPGVGTQFRFLLPFEQAEMRDNEKDVPVDVESARLLHDAETTTDGGQRCHR